MPALKQIAPVILKEVLEAADWRVYNEDRLNWSMVNKSGQSVEIPKRGRLVSFDVMESAMSKADLLPGDYFRCLQIVEDARRSHCLPLDGSERLPKVQ